MWFGDERRYNATNNVKAKLISTLWFGDERRYNATPRFTKRSHYQLWFGDERRYNATTRPTEKEIPGCGLVMKEDITQQIQKQPWLPLVVVW